MIVVVVVLIILGSIGGSSSTGNDTASESVVYKVGDQIESGDSILTVTKVTKNWKSSNQFDKPSSPNDVYVLVSLSIENKGTDDLSLAGMWDFKLEDSNGVQRSQALGGVGISQLPTGSLSPNGKASGDILFDADKNALDNLKLHYQPLLSFNKKVIVDLQ